MPPQPYVGEIRMFAGNFPPNGWMFCEGQELPISEYEVLFQLIGTTYGGDGQEVFTLPNLASRLPMHMGTGPDGVSYPIGQMAGTEQETLTLLQMPAHTHPLLASEGPADSTAPSGRVLAESVVRGYVDATTPTSPMHAASIAPLGGSQPHENVQPFLCINFIISLYGIFPSQT